MTLLVLTALTALAGCNQAPPLPPPGASGTITVNIWETGGSAPTVLVADRIRQEGVGFKQVVLERVRARVVQPNLDCAVTSPSGTWDLKSGQLLMTGPVHLAGSWEGRPMLGVATGASLSRDGQSLALEHLELWHQGQRLLAPVAELRRDRSLVAPRGMDASPLPGETAAAFAALPDPLPLPR